jgi:hypothetical protein
MKTAFNQRLNNGECRNKLNALLKALDKKTTIDALASMFFNGTNGKKILFEPPLTAGAAAGYSDGVIRIGPRANPNEPSQISARGNAGNFLHELIHAASGGSTGFSHSRIVEGMYGEAAFRNIRDQIQTDAKAKGLKGDEKDKYIDNAFSGKMNAWLGQNCPT